MISFVLKDHLGCSLLSLLTAVFYYISYVLQSILKFALNMDTLW